MGSTDMKTPQYGEVLAPTEGRILDPACGSGGMFVQTAHYIEKHKAQGKQMNLRAYGVEKTGAKAYLDLKKRKDLGEKVDSSDINDDEIAAALFRLHGADSWEWYHMRSV